MNTVEIKEFDLLEIKPKSTILIMKNKDIPNQEKLLIINLLENYKSIPAIVVFSKTNFYESIVPEVFIHPESTNIICEKIIQRQEIMKCSKKISNPKLLIIIDIEMNDNLNMILDKKEELDVNIIITTNDINNIKISKMDYLFIYPIKCKAIYENLKEYFNSYNQYNQLINNLSGKLTVIPRNNLIKNIFYFTPNNIILSPDIFGQAKTFSNKNKKTIPQTPSIQFD